MPLSPDVLSRPDVSPLVEIRDLRVAFSGVPALRGIDFSVARGEAVGLVGESGCGKSITWLAALGLLGGTARVEGSVRLEGEELLGAAPSRLDTVRGGRIAMIFQDPASALNPVHRLGRQVEEALRLHRGLSGAAARAEALRLFDRVGIPDAARRLASYPHEMSGGQNQRVMIAMALAGAPDLLIADEPTTALDATIQAQILDLLREIQAESGMALVLISHDLGVVADLCARVGVMYAGRLVEMAPAAELFAAPAHPYTRGLLGALPDMTGPRRRLMAIPGQVPEPGRLPAGCAFAPRCPRAGAACAASEPRLAETGPDHLAACLNLAVAEAAAA
jgi:peptide/nickel transport system ATP-binding protein